MPSVPNQCLSSNRYPLDSICRSIASVLFVAAALVAAPRAIAQSPPPADASSNVEIQWLRPIRGDMAVPRWGHRNGLQVGLEAAHGPRGLLRIYAPYLGAKDSRVINFIAIEPIPRGATDRGLSELEHSQLDNVRGKRLWSQDSLDDRAQAAAPARGVLETVDGVACLRVFIMVEPFENGADVAIRLTFRADRPHEVGLATYTLPDSVELEHCIVTATMGNYARLRQLQLADRVVTPAELWPDYREDGFTPHAKFPLAELSRTPDGGVRVSATSDESDPVSAKYAPGTNRGWHYRGVPARQWWRVERPHADLAAWVNGRHIYWASQAPIPGGTAYENFELVSPFSQGDEFWFGVETPP